MDGVRLRIIQVNSKPENTTDMASIKVKNNTMKEILGKANIAAKVFCLQAKK
jgi:hypothetical protein